MKYHTRAPLNGAIEKKQSKARKKWTIIHHRCCHSSSDLLRVVKPEPFGDYLTEKPREPFLASCLFGVSAWVLTVLINFCHFRNILAHLEGSDLIWAFYKRLAWKGAANILMTLQSSLSIDPHQVKKRSLNRRKMRNWKRMKPTAAQRTWFNTVKKLFIVSLVVSHIQFSN